MEDEVSEYYDPMARDYHLLFANWRETVMQEAETLDRLIREHLGTSGSSVLDCACGIGTQSIALATRGYKVQATDVSEGMIQRARKEADSFQVSVNFGVADILTLESQVRETFDVVLAFDNAMPHFQQDSELLLAARSLASRLKENGLFLATMRDYDCALEEKARFVNEQVFEDSQGKRVVFQIWDWFDREPLYRVHQFIVQQESDNWKTSHFEGEYRALRRSELSDFLGQAGLSDIRWYLPEESGYYQPVVAARKRG